MSLRHRIFYLGQQGTLVQRFIRVNTAAAGRTTTTTSPSPTNYYYYHHYSRFGDCGSRSRMFSSFDNNNNNNNKTNDPFAILGIPSSSSYDHVKRAFVRLALEKHPDLQTAGAVASSSNNSSGSRKSSSTEEFIQIRQAFEAIHHLRRGRRHGTNQDHNKNEYGTADDEYDDTDDDWPDDSIDEIVSNLFMGTLKMTSNTRQEVINAYKTMAPGGKDKGGYWEMARQMAERQEAWQRSGGRNGNDNSNHDDGPILRLEAVSSSSSSTTSISRRRRKR